MFGVWIALEDATLENGCLWFIPGSHKGKRHSKEVTNIPSQTSFSDGLLGQYRMVKNEDETSAQTCVFIGEKQEYDDTKFVPLPVKKGELGSSLVALK